MNVPLSIDGILDTCEEDIARSQSRWVDLQESAYILGTVNTWQIVVAASPDLTDAQTARLRSVQARWQVCAMRLGIK